MLLAVLAVLLIGVAPFVAADEDEIPTIAMMNFGYSAGQTLATKGAFDVLQAYGYFNEEERLLLDEGKDLFGENMNVLWRNAGSDTPTANLMVEDVLDRGVDAMLIVTTQVTQIATNATRDLEDPPAIMFSLVGSPYFAGIADAPCIKPDHVGGSQYHLPYAESVAVMQVWNPDIKVVGIIVAPGEPISVSGARSLRQAAENLGMTVEEATVVTLSDLNLATEALVNRGVEALINPVSSIILSGTTLLQSLTAEYGIPLFGIFPYHVYNGATTSCGRLQQRLWRRRHPRSHAGRASEWRYRHIRNQHQPDRGLRHRHKSGLGRSARRRNTGRHSSCWRWRKMSLRTASAPPAPLANCRKW